MFCLRAEADSYTARVIGISDGDTLTVLHRKQPEKIRLANIDCPERHQAYGSAAKDLTSRLAFGSAVTVHEIGQDRYRRTIADIELSDGRDLSEEIVRAGLGWCFTKYCHDPKVPDIELLAREKRIGLWQEDNPMPPWKYRQLRISEQRVALEK